MGGKTEPFEIVGAGSVALQNSGKTSGISIDPVMFNKSSQSEKLTPPNYQQVLYRESDCPGSDPISKKNVSDKLFGLPIRAPGPTDTQLIHIEYGNNYVV